MTIEQFKAIKQFDAVEKGVEKLITRLKLAEQSNRQLQDRIHDLEVALETKKHAETAYLEERNRISAKLDQLLCRIDEIEKSDES